ncbi:hypothetical protein PSAC2689_20243 [Paraburkholderia sacchari]
MLCSAIFRARNRQLAHVVPNLHGGRDLANGGFIASQTHKSNEMSLLYQALAQYQEEAIHPKTWQQSLVANHEMKLVALIGCRQNHGQLSGQGRW